MPSPEKSSITSLRGAVRRDGPGQDAHHANSEPEWRSTAQLARLADFVARGELPLPDDLLADQLEHLALEVRKRRRTRLVEYIARTIATDIHRSSGP